MKRTKNLGRAGYVIGYLVDTRAGVVCVDEAFGGWTLSRVPTRFRHPTLYPAIIFKKRENAVQVAKRVQGWLRGPGPKEVRIIPVCQITRCSFNY